MQAKASASADFAGVTSELGKVTETLSILELLLEVHQLHQTVNEQLSRQDFCEASSALAKMKLALGRLERSTQGLEITKVSTTGQLLLAL